MKDGPQTILNETPKEYGSRFILEIFGAGNWLQLKASNLGELSEDLDNIRFNVEKIHFSKPQFLDEYNDRNKLGEILHDFAKRSFTLTQISAGLNVNQVNLVEQATGKKIEAFLERNRQFSVRKLKIALISSLLTLITCAMLYASLPIQLISLALAGPGANLIMNACNKHNGQLNTPLNISIASLIILISSLITLSLFNTALPACLNVLFGFGGLFLNYIRDREIKISISTYNDTVPNFKDEECESFKKGISAQNANILFTPLYWTSPTWKWPRAYFAAYHSNEWFNDEKIRNIMKI